MKKAYVLILTLSVLNFPSNMQSDEFSLFIKTCKTCDFASSTNLQKGNLLLQNHKRTKHHLAVCKTLEGNFGFFNKTRKKETSSFFHKLTKRQFPACQKLTKR